ncbi:hypothetical protein [Lysobacter sp. D1-1-M9]|uniref:hypothetical protein n=1 Tax=Novilysobacter longmucuonensis TaxID=3098603 RepID=UPI002FC7E7D2
MDHRLEGVASVRALLLQVCADGGEVPVADGFGEEATVSAASFLVGGAQRALGGVQSQQRVIAQAAQRCAAGDLNSVRARMTAEMAALAGQKYPVKVN